MKNPKRFDREPDQSVGGGVVVGFYYRVPSGTFSGSYQPAVKKEPFFIQPADKQANKTNKHLLKVTHEVKIHNPDLFFRNPERFSLDSFPRM